MGINGEIVKVQNGYYVLTERKQVESWMIDIREAQGYSQDKDFNILEEVLTKMQNELNSQYKEITSIEQHSSGETKYGLSEWKQR